MTLARPSWDEYFLNIAQVVATRGNCTRRQVGMVIVKDNRIVSTGYNGAPSGEPGCLTDGACPRGRLSLDEHPSYMSGNQDFSNCTALHDAQNAVAYASREDTVGATAYTTDKPCDMCGKLLRAAGVVRVVWPGSGT